ncbi:hypothetical protein [Candidatus Viridilinea mediisalina]|uniref:IPT/TIG domain-containing protein n=1 Tax=Candidatus Viridilinea mediisalina TaxID=2024553 RepID=A0A2A6RDK8_9CHLR|nr:hypothetical protein [Candidatus Viridilinea mediisalina]PDV99297.1 hypothetical protein CJ255_21635 [Candidatus Viridilinea mediisalina]
MQIQHYLNLKRTVAVCFAGTLALIFALWSWSSFAAASLTASPHNPQQNDTVTLVGNGFSPSETVSVWITYPDYTVYAVAEVQTNDNGSFSYPYVPDFLGATFSPTGRYTYTAFGQTSGREVYASIDVAIGQGAAASQQVSFSADISQGHQGSRFVFRGSGYGPGEEVALWLRYPDNRVTDLGRTTAGSEGIIEYVLAMGGAPVGNYALTAYGLRSDRTGIAEFELLPGDRTHARSEATLNVGPDASAQHSHAAFSASGFQAGEVVTIWVTMPDGSTRWIGDIVANNNGSLYATLYLNERDPVGPRVYTAFGNRSGARATANYQLVPGSGWHTGLVHEQ